MSRIGRRGVIAGPRGAAAKTYADFQAHIAGLATGGTKAFNGAIGVGNGAYKTTATTATFAMYGSPWLYFMDAQSGVDRCVQHSMPSQAVFNAQVSSGRELFFRVQATANYIDIESVGRNGYTSLAYNDGNSYPALICTELLYWDGTQAQRMTPNTGGGPTPYTW